MSIFTPTARVASTSRRTVRRLLAGTVVFSMGLVGVAPAFAAELVTASSWGRRMWYR